MKRALFILCSIVAVLAALFTGGQYVAAQVPISGLPSGTTPPSGTELIPMTQSGTTVKMTLQQLLTGPLSVSNTAIIIGNSSNKGIVVFLSSDCTLANTGAITCTKTNGVSFGAAATATTPLSQTLGGTGVNNGSNTITLGGNVSTTNAFSTGGAFSLNLTATGATTDTMPSGTNNVASLNQTGQAMTGGVNLTTYQIGTVSSGTTTIACGNGPVQVMTNNGASVIAAPTSDGTCLVSVGNAGSAGAISFSGFTVGGNTGDSLTTTNGKTSTISMWRINGVSSYVIKDLF